MSMKPWIKTLRHAGMFWLRYECQCLVVACERPPTTHSDYHPDILGITKNRRFMEIEIKVSSSDLRADKDKRRHDPRLAEWRNPAHRFYYLVTPKLEAIALAELSEEFGVLGMRFFGGDIPENAESALKCSVVVLRKAKNREKPKATIEQCIRMAQNVSATCITMAREIAVHLVKNEVKEKPKKKLQHASACDMDCDHEHDNETRPPRQTPCALPLESFALPQPQPASQV